MSATQREHVIQVPDTTPASEGEATGGVPDDPADEPSIGLGWCEKALMCFAVALVVAFLVFVVTLRVLDGTSHSHLLLGGHHRRRRVRQQQGVAERHPAAVRPHRPHQERVRVLRLERHDGRRVRTAVPPSARAGTVPMFCTGKRDEGEPARSSCGRARVGRGRDAALGPAET